MKSADIARIENLLLDNENNYVGACGRFLSRVETRDSLLLLRENINDVSAFVINSRSTVIPVLCGLTELPDFKNLKSFFKKKKIHSVQGLKNEVLLLEDAIKRIGKKEIDMIDYDLMSLDKQPVNGGKFPSNLEICAPQMIDLDAIAPLQAGYEKEEVLPKGSDFSPAASRLNIANIIANSKILAARINGRFVGKINISAVSFTRYQVGGVYVHPDFRGLGIARRMASVFISSLINEGRGVTLFVKKSNIAAQKLYTRIGFTRQNDYRITYY